jgi:cytochrome c553
MKIIPRQAPPGVKGLLSVLGAGVLGLLLTQSNAFAQTGPLATADNAFDQYVIHPKIPLLDEQGQNVLTSGKVYSPKKTCEGSGCHDYEKIGHSYHIEFGRDEADDHYGKKVGVPHLVSPGWFGGYNCMSGNTPSMLSKKSNGKANDYLDWGSVDFIKGCSTCHMGGGFMEKDRDGIRYDQKAESTINALDSDYYTVLGRGTIGGTATTGGTTTGGSHMGHSAKSAMGKANGVVDTVGFDTIVDRWDWKKSGVVEIDCISCHVGLNQLKKFPASGLGAGDGVVVDNAVVKANSDNSYTALQLWGYLRDGQANPATPPWNGSNSGMIRSGYFKEAATAFLEFMNLKLDDPNGLQLVTFEKKNFQNVGTTTNGVTTYKTYFDFVLGADGRPVVHWNPKAFDADGKVSLPMKRFTPNENCMNCHSTANGRRGFYGFGDASKMMKDPDGVIQSDYKDDVHKGKSWTAPNGVTRKIDNCNACHAKNYFNPSHSTPELDNDHQFPKGNSDMDVRNDLDYNPDAKSCVFCHEKSASVPDPVIPSGHATLLKAHEELWRNNGDMAGYSKDTLTKITKTHMDVISCEACHITGLENGGKKVPLLYQYKKQEDGLSKITSFNPYQGVRSTWRDKKSDKVLSRAELAMVYQDAPKDASGLVTQGIIINALDGSELGRVGKTGAAYDAPRTYEQFMALKTAYDKLMEKRGFPGTDMQYVWAEANSYMLNHGTKPSAAALPCADCHERKQSGAWSALIGPSSILGDQGPKNLVDFYELRGKNMAWTIPDQRLLDEGHIRFDAPYLKRDPANGHITARTGDVLHATRIDPFLTIAKNSSAKHIFGDLRATTLSAALGNINMVNDDYRKALEASSGKTPVFYFNTSHGAADLQNAAVIGLGGGIADKVLPEYRLTLDLYADLPQSLVSTLEAQVAGSKLTSSAFWFNAKDKQNKTITQFMEPLYIKMPYKGKATTPEGVRILSSADGSVIKQLEVKSIIDVKPDNDAHAGYVIFSTSQFGWFAVLDVK